METYQGDRCVREDSENSENTATRFSLPSTTLQIGIVTLVGVLKSQMQILNFTPSAQDLKPSVVKT